MFFVKNSRFVNYFYQELTNQSYGPCMLCVNLSHFETRFTKSSILAEFIEISGHYVWNSVFHDKRRLVSYDLFSRFFSFLQFDQSFKIRQPHQVKQGSRLPQIANKIDCQHGKLLTANVFIIIQARLRKI